MQEFILKDPYPNGSVAVEPDGKAYVDALLEMEAMHLRGEPVYVKYLIGDRKGSIARFVPNYMPGDALPNHRKCESIYGAKINAHARVYHQGNQVHGHRYQGGAHGVCHWDDRRNKVKAFIPHGFAWMKDYQGPTVWEKFDAKAAKADLLNNVMEQDIDGKKLAVGDEVIYVNSRYGSGTELCHGVIDRFEAKADSRGHTVFTIVKERGKDVESKIQYPGAYIWKK